MITILPVHSGPEKQEIRQEAPALPADALFFLMADSKGKKYGWIAARMKGVVLELLSVRLSRQADALGTHFCAESLIRAAASYGETKGAVRIVCRQEKLYPILLAAGFTQEPEMCAAPMSALVKSSKETR